MRLILIIIAMMISGCLTPSYIVSKVSRIKVFPPAKIIAGEIACITEDGTFYSLPLRAGNNPICINYLYTVTGHRKSLARFRYYRSAYQECDLVVQKHNKRTK